MAGIRFNPAWMPFGRTNIDLPREWLRPMLPLQPDDLWRESFRSAVAESGRPVDTSSSPALWGEILRGLPLVLSVSGGDELEHATSADHAVHLLQGHLLQVLSGLGRPCLDFFFLNVSRVWEEHQLNGAMEALENARQDGLIRFAGLRATGPALAALGVWQFRDAFEAVMMPAWPQSAYETLAPIARERRVGVILEGALSRGTGCCLTELAAVAAAGPPQGLLRVGGDQDCVVCGVRTAEEVTALGQPVSDREAEAVLTAADAAWTDPQAWRPLNDDPRPWVRHAAERRIAELA